MGASVNPFVGQPGGGSGDSAGSNGAGSGTSLISPTGGNLIAVHMLVDVAGQNAEDIELFCAYTGVGKVGATKYVLENKAQGLDIGV